MFGIGMPEMLVILAVALIVFGPKKLPDLAKSLGRALNEFKRATSDLKESIQAETNLTEVRKTLQDADKDLKSAVAEQSAPALDASQGEAGPSSDQNPLDNVKKAFEKLNQPADSSDQPVSSAADAAAQPADGSAKSTP